MTRPPTSPNAAPGPEAPDDEAFWSLFDALCELPADQAARRLASEPLDAPRRTRLAALLAAHRRTDTLLDTPPDVLAALETAVSDPAEGLVGRRLAGYRVLRVLGTGGSSTVFEAEQDHPRRRVALKVLRVGLLHPDSLARFQQEYQVLARLQHPGIAQIHDAGTLDGPAGPAPFFAMELVDGPNLIDFADAQALSSRARCKLLAAVCDAVQHAHGKGVIHRDLKPANILVNAAGQPKIVDFGVARALGDEFESVTLTRDGQCVGTLPYMSPEQLAGRREEIDVHADVYALGVLGYRLLGGVLPHELDGLGPVAAAERVQHERPARLGSLRPELRGDLETVLGKALAVEPEQRYATAAALGDDLRRHLAHLPITARPPRAAYVLRKFVRRHRGVAAGFVVACAALVVASAVSLHLVARERAAAERMALMADLAEVESLPSHDAGIWPVRSGSVPYVEAWLARLDALEARLPASRRALAELRAGALPLTAAERAADARDWEQRHARLLSSLENHAERAEFARTWHARADARLMGLTSLERHTQSVGARLERMLEQLVEVRGQRTTWRYADPVDAWTENSLARLIERVEALGLPGEPNRRTLNRGAAERLLAYARTLRARTVDEQAAAWAEARAALADRARSPRYDGLLLDPVEGLLPLGPDPDSGLWEFAHVPSGFPVTRDPDSGRLVLHESMGVVLVLLPGGEACLGATPRERDLPGLCAHLDPLATPDEEPPHHVRLDPFFISKYELTQRQWMNLSAGSPSTYDAYNFFDPEFHMTGRQPVESVTWLECAGVARRMGLALPTEAQWEHAARGGSDAPRWCAPHELAVSENLADRAYLSWTREPEAFGEPWDDGHRIHAAVGSHAPNAYGLHEMLGNLREWCRDRFGYHHAHPRAPRNGELLIEGAGDRVVRGGSYRTLRGQARASRRTGRPHDSHRADDLGVRFVLELPEVRRAPPP